MTYAIQELSEQIEPIELYRFDFDGTLWLMTSADTTQTYLGDEYESTFVSRGGFINGGDGRKSNIELEVASSNSIVDVFRHGWLHAPMILTIYRHYYNDFDYVVIWKGRVTNCVWNGETSTLSSESILTVFGRAGLRRSYSLGCTYPLYDSSSCKVDKDSYEHSDALDEVSGSSFTMSSVIGFGDGYFIGGMIQFEDEFRMIVNHNGNTITMLSQIDGLSDGDTVSLWPGCDRTLDTCASKFSNHLNYGGQPFIPSTNPFKGTSLV